MLNVYHLAKVQVGVIFDESGQVWAGKTYTFFFNNAFNDQDGLDGNRLFQIFNETNGINSIKFPECNDGLTQPKLKANISERRSLYLGNC